MEIILSIFDKYGWVGVVVILLCIILYYGLTFLSNKLSKSLSTDMSVGFDKVGEKLTDQMSRQNDKLIDTILGQHDTIINHMVTRDNDKVVDHNKKLSNRIKISKEIDDMLKVIMNKENAQRAFIVEFHNSYSNISSIPFAKWSMTYECFDQGILPLQSKSQAMPFNQFANIAYEIMGSPTQQNVYDNMQDMREKNQQLSNVLFSAGITKIVYNALYDNDNNLFGILCIEYHIPKEQTHVDLDKLKIMSEKISTMITMQDTIEENYTHKLNTIENEITNI